MSGEESWSDQMVDTTRDFAGSDLCLEGLINSHCWISVANLQILSTVFRERGGR